MAAYLRYNAAEEVFPLHIWARRAVHSIANNGHNAVNGLQRPRFIPP